MKKENIAALLIAGALLNVSASAMPAIHTAQIVPRSDFELISIYDTKPSRESIQALREAERAAAEKTKVAHDSNVGHKTIRVLATAYCGCYSCCGKEDRITSTGVRATEGRTIAVDPRMIPYGTHVLITDSHGNTHEFIAEDCGGDIQNHRIDIYFESHADANTFGRQWVELEVIK